MWTASVIWYRAELLDNFTLKFPVLDVPLLKWTFIAFIFKYKTSVIRSCCYRYIIATFDKASFKSKCYIDLVACTEQHGKMSLNFHFDVKNSFFEVYSCLQRCCLLHLNLMSPLIKVLLQRKTVHYPPCQLPVISPVNYQWFPQ